ncbi:chorismate--pyruvate lyase family protein [Noviherbaspirillum aerium]|uniref:chorismate--pyruvate lyase family protein n=1 Tax=Noviherbaspirillum aerium TaxID=2588497 RepID=UPI00124F109E|nr:chorismate lyase [Noviherbaspirillum aerium]
MTARSFTHARWSTHVNAVCPERMLRDWLVDDMSLTQKLSARSGQFRVQRLRQARGVCLRDEYQLAGLPRPLQVQEREVLLRCDGRPVVFAHTVVPLAASAADWPFFGTLGDRSLGTTLFGDPRVARGRLQYARLPAQHPLTRRASRALEGQVFASPLFARRCLYQRKKGVLLVTEVFLPAIADLGSTPRQQLGRHDESTR